MLPVIPVPGSKSIMKRLDLRLCRGFNKISGIYDSSDRWGVAKSLRLEASRLAAALCLSQCNNSFAWTKKQSGSLSFSHYIKKKGERKEISGLQQFRIENIWMNVPSFEKLFIANANFCCLDNLTWIYSSNRKEFLLFLKSADIHHGVI